MGGDGGPLRNIPGAPDPQEGIERQKKYRAKAECDCSKDAGLTQKGNAGTVETLERVLGAQCTLLVERAMPINNYCS